jgi:hypothetical protein
VCRFGLVPKRVRPRIKILHGEVARQQLAIAIGQIGARDRETRRENVKGAVTAQYGDIDQTNANESEGHRAQDCSDNDAPLYDAGPFAHAIIVQYRKWA